MNIRFERHKTDVYDWRPLLVGIIMSSSMLVQFIGRGSNNSVALSSLIMLFAMGAFGISYPKKRNIPISLWFTIFGLFISVFFSVINAHSVLGFDTLPRAFALLACIFIGVIISTRVECQVLEKAFYFYSVSFVFVLFFVLIDNNRIFDRLNGHLHPNLWGFLAGTTLVGLLYAKSGVLIRLVFVAFLIYLLAFQFQARGAFISASVVSFSFIILSLYNSIRNKRSYLSAQIFLIYVFLMIIVFILIFSNYIWHDILSADSKTRGIESGFSGRFQIWDSALNLFSQRPLFGFGFDMSRFYATNYDLGSVGSVHNSFISILFDWGLVGFSFYIFLIYTALWGTLSSKNAFSFAFIAIYLLIGLTESRPLNVGNPSGIFFIVFLIFFSCKKPFFVAR